MEEKKKLISYETEQLLKLDIVKDKLLHHIQSDNVDLAMMMKLTVINEMIDQLIETIDGFANIDINDTIENKLDAVASVEEEQNKKELFRFGSKYIPSIIAFDMLGK